MKNFIIKRYFSPEKPMAPEINLDQQVVNNKIFATYPELKNLNLPQEQLEARAAIISKLNRYIDDKKKFEKWNIFPGSVRESVRQDMITLRTMLTESFDVKKWDAIQNTHFHKIEADDSVNMELDKTRMTWRTILQRVGGDAGVILKPVNAVKTVDVEKLSPEQKKEQMERIEKKTRLSTFLLAIESAKHDQLQDKDFVGNKEKVTLAAAINHTRSLLAEDKVDEAILYFHKAIDGQWKNIDVMNTMKSDTELARVKRKLGDSDGEKFLSEWLKNLDKNHPIVESIDTRLKNPDSSIISRADNQFREILAKLPAGHPELIKMETASEDYKRLFQFNIILREVVDEFIKTHGDKNLPLELKEYNDMKGLHGWNNLSDGNVKLVKEGIIILGSLAATFLTLWMGSAALGASLARLGFAANSARTAAVAANAAKAGHAARAATAVGKTVAQAFPSAFVFTASDTVLRQVGLGSDGDRRLGADVSRSFTDFAGNLAKNTAMFAAFAGMEKIIGGAYTKYVSGKITSMSKIVQIPVEWGRLVSLAAGDVAAMSALHAAETGNWTIEAEQILLALIFRMGFKSVEKFFPNSTKKLKEQNSPQELDDKIQDAGKKLKNSYSGKQNDPNFVGPKQPRIKSEGDNMLVLREEKMKIVNGDVQAGEIMMGIGGKNYIYNAGTKRWHILADGETVLSAKFPKKWSLTSDQMRQAIMKEYPMPVATKKPANTTTKPQKTPDQNPSFGENTALKKRLDAVKDARENAKFYERKLDDAELKNLLQQNNKNFEGEHIRLEWKAWNKRYFATYRSTLDGEKIVWQKITGNTHFPSTGGTPKNLNQIPDQIQWAKLISREHYVPKDTQLKRMEDLVAQSEKIRSPLIKNTENTAQTSTAKQANERTFSPEEQQIRTELANAFKNPKRDDIIKTPDGSEWRYTADGTRWQQRESGKNWFDMDYTQGIQKTNAEMRKEYFGNFRKYVPETAQPSVPSNTLPKTQNSYSGKPNDANFVGPHRLRPSDEINGFFKAERIKDADDFYAKHQILKDRHKQLTDDLAKDPGNINIKWDLLQVETALKRFDDIALKMKNSFVGPIKPENIISTMNDAAPGLGNKLKNAIDGAKTGNTEALRQFFQENWRKWLPGVGAYLIWQLFNTEKNNPFYVLPVELSDDPQKAFEQCLLCFTENPASTLDFSRKNAKWNVMTEDLRVKTSERWMKTAEWQNMMIKWNATMDLLRYYEPNSVNILEAKMNAIITHPTVDSVKDLQRCVNMDSKDTKFGQDGILGPNTTREILRFIDICQTRYEKLSSGESSQSSDNPDLMYSINGDIPPEGFNSDAPVAVATEPALESVENLESAENSDTTQNDEFYNVGEITSITDDSTTENS